MVASYRPPGWQGESVGEPSCGQKLKDHSDGSLPPVDERLLVENDHSLEHDTGRLPPWFPREWLPEGHPNLTWNPYKVCPKEFYKKCEECGVWQPGDWEEVEYEGPHQEQEASESCSVEEPKESEPKELRGLDRFLKEFDDYRNGYRVVDAAKELFIIKDKWWKMECDEEVKNATLWVTPCGAMIMCAESFHDHLESRKHKRRLEKLGEVEPVATMELARRCIIRRRVR